MDILVTPAVEGGAYNVTVGPFTDFNGDAVTPKTDVVWTVFDRHDVQISTGTVTAAATVQIVIKGTDLKVTDKLVDQVVHKLKIATTYDSDLGNDMPFVKFVKFPVENDPGAT